MYAYLSAAARTCSRLISIVQRDVIENRVGKEIHPAIPPQFGFSVIQSVAFDILVVNTNFTAVDFVESV
jgi:hypothetical protein